MSAMLGFFASDLCESPKVHEAARQCGISPYTLVGYLVHLWGQVLEQSPDGTFGPVMYEQFAPQPDGWPAHFLMALCNVRLVEVWDGYYAIHDWDQYSGRVHLRRQANTLAVRAFRARQQAHADVEPVVVVPVPSVDLPRADVVQLEQPLSPSVPVDLWGHPLAPAGQRRAVSAEAGCPADYDAAFWQALEEAFRAQGRRMPRSPVEREKWQKTRDRFWQDGVTAADIPAVFTVYVRAMRDKIVRGEDPYRFTAAALRNNVADWLLPAVRPLPEREDSHDAGTTTIAESLAQLADQPSRTRRGGRADTTFTAADRALLRGERADPAAANA